MTLDYHMQRINRELVSSEEKTERLYNDYLHKVFDCLVNNMKTTDEVFGKLFKTPHYQGSSFEKLKVGCRDEFDINLELELPVNYDDIEIETDDTSPGFARIRLGDFKSNVTDKVRRTVEKWMDDQRYLHRDAVLRWLKGAVDKALLETRRRLDLMNNLKMITRKESGPAVTIYVTTEGGQTFSVDLVPVLMFKNSKWPSDPLRSLVHLPRAINTSFLEWSVVPKGPRDAGKRDPTQWRMSFYPYEKALMNGIDGMKPVIRLLKLLRDKQGWPNLSSYFIKTVFLWELDKNYESLWAVRGNSYGSFFLHMLQVLEEEYLADYKIPFYWDKRCNLVEHLHQAELERIHGSLKRLRRKLSESLNNPNALENVVNDMFKYDMLKFSGSEDTGTPQTQQESGTPQTQQESADWSTAGVVAAGTIAAVAIGGAIAFFTNRRRN